MPRFDYEALNRDGQSVSGALQADTDVQALERLRLKGLMPYRLSQSGPGSGPSVAWWKRELSFGNGLSSAALARFTRELATLIDAELPLDECLRILQRHAGSRRLRALSERLLADTMEGLALSQSVAQSPADFPPLYANMIKAGEAGGSLGPTLNQLATYLERAADLRAKLASALIYPAVLLLMALATILVLVTVMIPQLMPLFESAAVEPPAVFRYARFIELAVTQYWPATMSALVLAISAIALLGRQSTVVNAVHGSILRLPIAGALIRKTMTARLSRSLGTLLSNGVSIHPALHIVAPSIANKAMQQALNEVRDSLRKGAIFSAELARSNLFDEVAVRLIRVGEQSGRLPQMLLHAAQLLEQETQRRIERLMSLLTPLLTLAIGLGVGTLIMSVMNAILSINELAF